MIHIHIEGLFQSNLTNGTLKEQEEDPLLIRWVDRGTQML